MARTTQYAIQYRFYRLSLNNIRVPEIIILLYTYTSCKRRSQRVKYVLARYYNNSKCTLPIYYYFAQANGVYYNLRQLYNFYNIIVYISHKS